MTFAGSINIRQTGHALLHIDKYDEDYLIPVPDAKVKGVFSGTLYPELSGLCRIISSSGFVSEINFSGKGFFGGGPRNAFVANVYRKDDKAKKKLYKVKGSWSEKFTFLDVEADTELETWDTSAPTAPLQMTEVPEQDAWETRNAWQHVLAPLKKGDASTTITEKTKLEEAQRRMRKKEKAGLQEIFRPLFFTPQGGGDALFESLAQGTGWQLQSQRTQGVWKFESQRAGVLKKPYHGTLTPLG